MQPFDLTHTESMVPIDISSVEQYLQANARPLDWALYQFQVRGAPAQPVIDALEAFQNADGGFGHGLEPDLGTPDSSALASSVALQYLEAIGADSDEPMIRRALDYLIATYDSERKGWAIIAPSTDHYPHAPWWEYKSAMAGFGWGNPSAELLGYLHTHDLDRRSGTFVDDATAHAIGRLRQLSDQGEADFHELLCFAHLANSTNGPLQIHIHDLLLPLIAGAVNRDPDNWGSYGATPLTFAARPGGEFASLFDAALVDQNLDLVERAIQTDHWEPTWDWGGNFPNAWDRARRDWAGKITLDNLVMLRAYGRVA